MIDDAIWRSELRTKLEIQPIWATRPKDIQRWLNRKRPVLSWDSLRSVEILGSRGQFADSSRTVRGQSGH